MHVTINRCAVLLLLAIHCCQTKKCVGFLLQIQKSNFCRGGNPLPMPLSTTSASETYKVNYAKTQNQLNNELHTTIGLFGLQTPYLWPYRKTWQVLFQMHCTISIDNINHMKLWLNLINSPPKTLILCTENRA